MADVTLHDLVSVYRAHERRVYSICRRYLPDAADAEDAVQETFIRASPGLVELPEERVGGFLTVVARNVCLNELRRRRRREHTDRRAGAPHLPEDDAQSIAILRADVDVLWASLSRRHQALFLLRFAGYSYEEIALRLHLSADTVRMGLLRARRRARRMLEGMSAVVAGRLTRWRRRRPRWCPAAGPWTLLGGGIAVRAVGGLGVLAVIGGMGMLRAAPPAALDGWTPVALASAPAVPASSLRDTEVTGLTVSPGYGFDHTVYASGYRASGCARGSCPALLRSRDGGRTWEVLPARGFQGGTVVLPPSYPRHGAIFAAGPDGLERSDDGGGTFRVVVTARGPAVALAGSRGTPVVVIAASRPVLYDEASGAVGAGPALPPGMTQPDDVVAAGSPGHILVAGRTMPAGTARPVAVVATCQLGGSCRELLRVSSASLLRLATPAGPGSEDVVASWESGLVASRDGGRTFSTVPGATLGRVSAAAAATGACGPLCVAAVGVDAPSGRQVMVLSTGGTRTPAPLPALGVAAVVAAVTPDGHVLAALAAPDQTGRWGVRCWTAATQRWQPRC